MNVSWLRNGPPPSRSIPSLDVDSTCNTTNTSNSEMQRTCCSCLARRIIVPGGTRSYGIVPKAKSANYTPTPKSNSDTSRTPRLVRKSSRRLTGYLADDLSSQSEKIDKPRSGASISRRPPSSKRRYARDPEHRDPLDGYSGEGSTILTNDRSRTMGMRKPPHPPALSPSSLQASASSSTSSPNRDRIHFKGLDHETAIPAFHRPSTPSNPIIKYRDKYLHLRATPSNLLSFPPSPFPCTLPTYSDRHPGTELVSFGVVASKNSVSPFAAERGRGRKRFKAAVEEVVNNGTGVVKDFRRDWSYLAVLNREVYEADMKVLCASLAEGLRFIKKQQDRGIGSGTSSDVREGRNVDRNVESSRQRGRSPQ